MIVEKPLAPMWRTGLAIVAALGLWPAAAAAQDATDRKVAEMIDTARQTYGPTVANTSCGAASSEDEIVVCAPDHTPRWRIPSTAESDFRSPEATNDGLPRAPNVSGLPDCSNGCIGFGSVPPPVYMIDFAKLPEAPEGSDADRIAKGEVAAP